MTRLLHVVRRGVPVALAETDWVVYEDGDGWRLEPHGAPPLPPGPIDAAQLHDLVFAADRAVVW
ncbi:MAG TPA: hypothetical protein VL463_17030 [Kofleriaceae bacterium]|nr:hypothetical protein [Kofleriaceae bacterium]